MGRRKQTQGSCGETAKGRHSGFIYSSEGRRHLCERRSYGESDEAQSRGNFPGVIL